MLETVAAQGFYGCIFFVNETQLALTKKMQTKGLSH
jgi:hypothetical protein